MSKTATASNQRLFEEMENNKSRSCAGILTDNGSTLNAINNELLDFRVDVRTSAEQLSSSTMSTAQKPSRNKSKMNNQNHYRRSHSHKSKNRFSHHNNAEHQPHDKLDHCQPRKSTSSTSSTSSGGGHTGGINVISNPLEAAVCAQPRTTIVVQQVSDFLFISFRKQTVFETVPISHGKFLENCHFWKFS